MADFFRSVGWSEEATAESVRRGREADARDNPGAFGDESPTFLVLADDRVVAYVSSIPTRVWSAGREVRAYWIKGLMVREEHRNGPLGYLVLKEAARHLRPSLVTTVHPASCRLFGALGFEKQGVLTNQVRVLKPGRVLAHLDGEVVGFGRATKHVARGLRIIRRMHGSMVAGTVINMAQAVWLAVSTSRDATLRVDVSDTLPPASELDALWERSRATMIGTCVRDSRHLTWRYAADADHPYRFLTARRDGLIVGLAIVRRPRTVGDGRLRGLRLATISDLVLPVDRPSIARTLVAAAEEEAVRCDADALLCSTSDPRLRRLLARRAFLSLPGNVHFFVRDAEASDHLPRGLERWWLMRGDGESDGTF